MTFLTFCLIVSLCFFSQASATLTCDHCAYTTSEFKRCLMPVQAAVKVLLNNCQNDEACIEEIFEAYISSSSYNFENGTNMSSHMEFQDNRTASDYASDFHVDLICTEYMSTVSDCIDILTDSCGDFGDTITSALAGLKHNFCDDDDNEIFREELISDTSTVDEDLCEGASGEFDLETSSCGSNYIEYLNTVTQYDVCSADSVELLCRTHLREAYACLARQIQENYSDCDQHYLTSQLVDSFLNIPAWCFDSLNLVDMFKAMTNFNSNEVVYNILVMFGCSHIRRGPTGKPITCSDTGNLNFFSNSEIRISIFTERPDAGSPCTVIRSVTVQCLGETGEETCHSENGGAFSNHSAVATWEEIHFSGGQTMYVIIYGHYGVAIIQTGNAYYVLLVLPNTDRITGNGIMSLEGCVAIYEIQSRNRVVAINRKRRQSGSVTVETAEASCDSIVDNDAYDVCVNDLVETGDEAMAVIPAAVTAEVFEYVDEITAVDSGSISLHCNLSALLLTVLPLVVGVLHVSA